MIGPLIYARVKQLVRSGKRAQAVKLAQRWRKVARGSQSACWFEYWARVQYHFVPPGEHLDLLREARRLARAEVNTATTWLVRELTRLYAVNGEAAIRTEIEGIVREAEEFYGESPWATSMWGELALIEGRTEEAREIQERVWASTPERFQLEVLQQRGLVEVDSGDREEGIRLLEASRGSRTDPWTYLWLAALWEPQDPGRAKQHLDRARELWQGPTGTFEENQIAARHRVNHGPFWFRDKSLHPKRTGL